MNPTLKTISAIAFLTTATTTAYAAAAPASPPAASPAAPAAPAASATDTSGKAIFAEACQACHSSNAEMAAVIAAHFPSAKPADLTKPDTWKKAKTDESLNTLVRGYLDAKKFTDDQVKQVVAYLKTIPQSSTTSAAPTSTAPTSSAPASTAPTSGAPTSTAATPAPTAATTSAAPAGAAARAGDPKTWKNPVPYTRASVAIGRKVYQDNGCASCHSEDGAAGDTPGLKGTNLTAAAEYKSGATDGEIFKSIWSGTADSMPAFESLIGKDTDNWHLVNYIKSLGIQPAPRE